MPTAIQPKGVIVETTDGFYCTNECCQDRRIPPHNTAINQDRETGATVIKALCDACGTFYKVTRKPSPGSSATVEIITDQAKKNAFRKRIEHVTGVMRATGH